jgi:anti-anti-sigma factor
VNVAYDLAAGPVSVAVLDDGMLVRLDGVLDESSLPALRATLLAPRRARCRDVIVDAGHVDSATDDALAVLVAASAWAASTGARFRMSSVSEPLRSLIDTLGLADALPTL